MHYAKNKSPASSHILSRGQRETAFVKRCMLNSLGMASISETKKKDAEKQWPFRIRQLGAYSSVPQALVAFTDAPASSERLHYRTHTGMQKKTVGSGAREIKKGVMSSSHKRYLLHTLYTSADICSTKPVIYYIRISPFNHLLSENGVHVCECVCVMKHSLAYL